MFSGFRRSPFSSETGRIKEFAADGEGRIHLSVDKGGTPLRGNVHRDVLSACGRDVVNRLSVSVQHPEERKDEAEGEPPAGP